MSTYRAVLLALVTVGSVLAVASPAGAIGVTDAPTPSVEPIQPIETPPSIENVQSEQTANDSENTTLGADISSFMQSSAAEIGGAVETGMWSAAFNGTNNQSVKTRLVERRTRELRGELQTLQQRRDELVAQHEAGEISETRYKAKLSHLLGRINALQSAIDTTAPKARQVGANVSQLQSMREEAKNLSGPEISAVARNTTGVGLGNVGGGPPANAAAGTNGTGVGAANGSTGDLPVDAPGNGNGNGNGDDNGGRPADVGNGDASANVTNPVEGNGTGNGPADESADVTDSPSSEFSSRLEGVSIGGALPRTFVGTLF